MENNAAEIILVERRNEKRQSAPEISDSPFGPVLAWLAWKLSILPSL